MTDAVNGFSEFLRSFLAPELVVFLISLLPILELRGGMIAASVLGVPWQWAMIITMIGTMLPVPFILLFIRKFLQFLKRFRPFRKMVGWIENKAMKKGTQLEEKYPKRLMLGLFLFVAIPLPGTGAWTGSLLAAFLGFKFKRAIPAICLGALAAGLIMSVFTYIIPAMMSQ